MKITNTSQNLVTLLAHTPGFASGYYPTCADRMEVTAYVATPADARTGINPLDPENLCGPLAIRMTIDPRPLVWFGDIWTAQPQLPVAAKDSKLNIPYTVKDIDLRLVISGMMGNIDAATHTWQRSIWRYDPSTQKHTAPAPGSPNDWTNINDSLMSKITPTGTTRSGGKYTKMGLFAGDSVLIRCTTDISGVSTTDNPLLDQTCTRIISEPNTFMIPLPLQTAPVAALAAENTTISKTVADNAQSSAANQLALTELPIAGKNIARKEQASAQKAIQNQKAMQNQGAAQNQEAVQSIDLMTAPNPAETQIGVRFTLPQDATAVTVEILDVLQRPVLIPLADAPKAQGEHEISVPVGTLPSGMYALQIRVRLTNGTTLLKRRSLMIVR
jgi:hypothetical protein